MCWHCFCILYFLQEVKYSSSSSRYSFLFYFRSPNAPQDFSTALKCLDRLHLVQEVVTLCRTFLSSNEECLRSIVQQALQNFKPNSEYIKEDISPSKYRFKSHIQVCVFISKFVYWNLFHCYAINLNLFQWNISSDMTLIHRWSTSRKNWARYIHPIGNVHFIQHNQKIKIIMNIVPV